MSNKGIHRRSFIKTFGLLGCGLASGGLLPLSSGIAGANGKPERFTDTRLAMGTYVSIILIHPLEKNAKEAVDAAFEEIDRLSRLMTRFDDESPIGRLNREGRLEDAHPDLIEVISEAIKYYRLTGGAFDISIKPVIDLFKEKFSGERAEYPKEKEIKNAINLVGSDKIEIKGRNIGFNKPGMGITLDGIAKGYIVDKVSTIFLGLDIANHLINAGGDVKAVGHRTDGRPWKVGIQDPMKKKEYLDTISLTDAAVATSGNYENYFDDEKVFHHIANPKTGLSPVLNSSASVIAPAAAEADALATGLMVMDPNDGINFIDSMPDREALIISREGRMKRSKGWESLKEY